MYKSLLVTFILCLNCTVASAAESEARPLKGDSANSASVDGPANTYDAASAVAASDNASWKGDKIQLQSDLLFYNGKLFAPNGSIFSVSDDEEQADHKRKLTVKFLNVRKQSDTLCDRESADDGSLCGKDRQCVRVCPRDEHLNWLSRHYPFADYRTTQTERCAPDGAIPVNTNETYVLDKGTIEKMDHTQYGWTFGAMAVPFKYQLHDKSIGGGSSVGTYLGFRFGDSGGAVTPVVSVGLVPSMTVEKADKTGTESRSGLTFATGVIFSIDKGTGIQVGVLFGQDRLGSNSTAPYPYEGMWWTSIMIGYRFI